MTEAFVTTRLREAAHDDAGAERLREFRALMEGDPYATGESDRADAWAARPEAQAAVAGMMGLATMAPPVDPRRAEEGLPD